MSVYTFICIFICIYIYMYILDNDYNKLIMINIKFNIEEKI